MSGVNPRVPRSGAFIAELLLRAAVRRYFLSLCSGRKVAGHAFAVSHIGSFCWFSGAAAGTLVAGISTSSADLAENQHGKN